MKTIEFSKKILIFAAVLNIIVIVFSLVMIWRTNDTSILAYLIPSVAAEVATGTGFYYNKAKKENSKKIANQMMADFADKYGIEAVMQLLNNLRDY